MLYCVIVTAFTISQMCGQYDAQHSGARDESPCPGRSWHVRVTLFFVLMVLITASADLSGVETWRNVASGPIESDVVVDDRGNVSFAVNDRWLYRLDREGNRSVRIRLPEAAGEHIMALSDGSVVFSTESGNIKRVSPGGRIAWRLQHNDGEELKSMAASNRGFLYLAYETGGIRALNYAGQPLWAIDPGHTPVLGPTLGSNGDIHIVSEDKELLVLNAQADIERSFQLDRLPSHMAINADDELVLVYEGHRVEIVEPQKGERRVLARGDSDGSGASVENVFVDSDGTVSLFTDEGVLLRHTGRPDREFEQIADSLFGAAAVGDGTFIITEPDGVFRRIDSAGRPLMTVQTHSGGGELSRPVVGRQGHVAVAGSEWTVHGVVLSGVGGRAFRGANGGAAADGRIGPVSVAHRHRLLSITEFRVRWGMIEGGDTAAAGRFVNDLEAAISDGNLRGMSLWASELLLTITGGSNRGAERVAMPAELVRRAFTLLGRIGDARAAAGLEQHALGERAHDHPDSVIKGLSLLGYSYRYERSELIDVVYRRAGGAGVSAEMDGAYLDAIELVWRQGGEISRNAIETIARLPNKAGSTAARQQASRLLGQFTGSAVKLLNGSIGVLQEWSLERSIQGL